MALKEQDKKAVCVREKISLTVDCGNCTQNEVGYWIEALKTRVAQDFKPAWTSQR